MRQVLLVLAVVVSPSIAAAELPLPADPRPVPSPGPAPNQPPAQPVADPFAAMRRYDPETPPPGEWRLMLSDLTIFRLNPLGLETRGRFGLQKRLYASHKPIGKNNFAFVGLYPKLNPASAQLGVGGELQPASIFNLRTYAEVQQYFGSVGYLQSYASADANWSDHARADTEDAAQKAGMFHVSIAPMLMMKVAKGKLALRSLNQLDYWDFDVRDGDVAAYEGTFDTLLPDKGWTFSMDNDLLYTGVPNLAVGLRHSWVHPFYEQRHFADQAAYDAYDDDNAHHRLGLFLARTLRDDGPSRFNKPTIVLIVSWYLSHRYRAGEPDTVPTAGSADDYISRAFPYFLIGFAFESDLLKVNVPR